MKLDKPHHSRLVVYVLPLLTSSNGALLLLIITLSPHMLFLPSVFVCIDALFQYPGTRELKLVRQVMRLTNLLHTAKNDEISPHFCWGNFRETDSFPVISKRGNGNLRFP